MRSFLLGLSVGAVVGLMLAPEKGSKSREKLAATVGSNFGGGEASEGRTQEQATPPNVWDRVRQEQAGPERPVTEQVESEAEAVTQVLNTAKRDELLSVPGIGKGTAKRIIKHRPYESEEEVLEEGIMPEKTLERVKEELVQKKQEIAS